jgi:hypothetical protein
VDGTVKVRWGNRRVGGRGRALLIVL